MLQDFSLKITGLSPQGNEFREGQELDVKVPADLDQFWRDNSHGTVICGECLVKPGHASSYGRGSFKEIDIIP